MTGYDFCPSCGSRRLYKEYTEEYIKQHPEAFSLENLYRCKRCAWHGFIEDYPKKK